MFFHRFTTKVADRGKTENVEEEYQIHCDIQGADGLLFHILTSGLVSLVSAFCINTVARMRQSMRK
jgi:hypothetical protein